MMACAIDPIIDYGQNLAIKGSFPFSNSGHSGGCNMFSSDGAVRFIRATIDRTISAKLITPARTTYRLARQLPRSQDAFAR
jgi:hypothetical protein